MHFEPILRVLSKRVKRYTFATILLSSFHKFNSNFSEIQQFGLISCMVLRKEFVSQTIVAMETGKRLFFSYYSNGFQEGKCFIKNMNFIDTYYRWKIENVVNSEMYILKKRVPKLKNIIFLHFMTTFHNFVLKI